MKNLVILALVASTQAIHQKPSLDLAQTSASLTEGVEQKAQWFLFDDIYNWLYCKYRKCDMEQDHPTTES